MAFYVTVDASGPLAVVNDMIRKVNHFKRVDIGTTFSEWQTEDMHRGRPFTLRARSRGRVATIIRPHSRFEVNRSRAAQRRLARRAKRASFTGSSTYRKWSTRPILRVELLEKLVTRMNEALHKHIVWKR